MEAGIQSNDCCGVPEAKLELELESDPPALPPRPPPRPRLNPSRLTPPRRTRLRKYILLCTLCGGLACMLAALLVTVYLLLRTYTSSLEHFETIPTYVPAAMLFITGFTVMCLARKQNRFIFLMKVCRICCVISSAACMYMTITTTVVHMSRLQRLRQCVYTVKTQTCTCYISEMEHSDPGTVFNGTPDCQVVHGILYSCLRALFGISVVGILICIFCCLLVFQLLSHERKRNYWCQLEMRCRYLYSSRNRGGGGVAHCACCQHNMNPIQSPAMVQPGWDPQQDISRFCTPGNLYTPNPVVVDEGAGSVSTCATMEDSSEGMRTSSWSWRLPWSRAPSTHTTHTSSQDCYETAGSIRAENQYGFQDERVDRVETSEGGRLSTVSYPQLGPPPPYPMNSNPMRRRAPPASVSSGCCPVLLVHPPSSPSALQDMIETIE